jgi:hypothetical protein
MSNYRDFVQDFPKRCRDVLVEFSKSAKERDRDVTLLLMAAVAGFVMPYERLRDGTAVRQPQLDRQRFRTAAEQLRTLLGTTVGTSGLFLESEGSWCFGPLASAVGTPDDWPQLSTPESLSPEKTVSDVLMCLRNGLAHGNVFSRSQDSNEIDYLIFVSGGTRGKSGKHIPLTFLVVSPADLRAFLLKWFDFVAKLSLPRDLVLEVVAEAA